MFDVNKQKPQPMIKIRTATRAELELYEKHKQSRLVTQMSSNRPEVVNSNNCKSTECIFKNCKLYK